MIATKEKILCVDDEANVLQAYERQLRKKFKVDTAIGGDKALELLATQGPYAVVLTDMRMPGMDGVQLLQHVQEQAPDAVRMMLTGNADLQTAINAVNEGNVFRFLTKPCPPETLTLALERGIQQYRLIQAEKELLEQTLRRSVEALTEILSLVNAEAFGRCARIQRYMKALAEELILGDVWRYEMMGMLSQIGCVVLPEGVLKKVCQGLPLDPEESQVFNQHPFIAADLLSKIPRMQEIADGIAYQDKGFDGTGFPHDERQGEDIPLGARMLKVVLDFDTVELAGQPKAEAILDLFNRPHLYDPKILQAFRRVLAKELRYERQDLKWGELKPNMILAYDLKEESGVLLIAKGQLVTPAVIARLKNYLEIKIIHEPFRMLVPLERKE